MQLGLFSEKKEIQLRPYQEEALASIPETGAFLICLATGLGKTVVMSRIPRRGRMLVLSHRDELVHQPEKYFDCSFGVEQGSEKSHGEEVISASVQSLVRRLDKFEPDDFDVVVVDEAHHSIATTYRKIINYFNPRLLLGFTAMPNRNDGIGLKAIYQDIIYEHNLRWGIENGYLSNIHCLRVDIGVDLQHVAQRLGDYAPDSLERAMNIEGANEAIAEAYKLYAKPPVLIFCASVAHAEALAKCIDGAVAVKGGEDRSEVVEAFSEKKIPCLTNCMVFTEGTDLPNVQTVIVARPTKNVSLYTQMVGRGTRLYPGKEYLTLIDCVGAGDNADLCTAPSLLGLDIEDVSPKQRSELQGNLFDIPEILAELEDSPQAWIKNVERVDLWAHRNNYDMHGVNYFRMPDGSMVLSEPRKIIPAEDSLGRIMWKGRLEPAQKVFDAVYNELQQKYGDKRALWDLNLSRHWGNSPATEKQKSIIRRHYPNFDVRMLTKFEAGQILTRHFAEPLTKKQKYILLRAGYDVEGLSKYDAIQIIRRLKGT
ncbi:MAG: DEAD/DEAH box helicase [Synergistaceae bacterium]|nr:DEAD/DEAH box helicase [Synergistaceae bacterium]